MRVTYYGICLLIVSALQGTLLNYIEVFNTKPNLFLVFVVTAAFFCGPRDGAIVGAVFGLFFDMLVSKTVGLHAVLYMYTGFLFGLLSENVLKQPTLVISIAGVLVATFVLNCFEYLFQIFFNHEIAFVTSLLYTILPETAYNSVITILIYIGIKKTAGVFLAGKE